MRRRPLAPGRRQYADGLITDPKTWKEHKAEFHRGASDAGKDPARNVHVKVLADLFKSGATGGSYPFGPTRSEESTRVLREGSVAALAVDFEKSCLIGFSRMISKASAPAILFHLDGTLVDPHTAT